jgi:hypothetical protein
MLNLIAKTDQENLIKENNDNYSALKNNWFLYETPPHLMRYTYARTQYLLPVPWTYFLVSENYSCYSYGYKGVDGNFSYTHSYNIKIGRVLFCGEKMDDSKSMMDAPFSNMDMTGNLCGASYSEFERNSEKSILFNYNYIDIFNRAYSAFSYDAGNNDYPLVHKTSGTITKVPLTRYLAKIWNSKNWPSFFKKWEKLTVDPINFWPSENTEIHSLINEIPLQGYYDDKQFIRSFDSIFNEYKLVPANIALMELV